jgi:hypothetical protein
MSFRAHDLITSCLMKPEKQTILIKLKGKKKKKKPKGMNVEYELKELDKRLDYAIWKDKD